MRLLALLAAGLFVGSVMADDKKEEKIDPAKLVGKWKATKYVGEVPKETMTFEFTKGGEVRSRYGDGATPTRLEGTYKTSGSTLEIAWKDGPKAGPKDALEIVKLTDTTLHLKLASNNKDEPSEFERIKDEKKDK